MIYETILHARGVNKELRCALTRGRPNVGDAGIGITQEPRAAAVRLRLLLPWLD